MSFEIDPKTGKMVPMSNETWEKINSRFREEYEKESTPKSTNSKGKTNIAEILRKLLEGAKVGKDGTLVLQNPKKSSSDTSPIESKDGNPVTKKAPTKLSDYTDEELTKRFQPTYSSESSKPKADGSYGYKVGPDNKLVPLTEDERNRINLYRKMSGPKDLKSLLYANSGTSPVSAAMRGIGFAGSGIFGPNPFGPSSRSSPFLKHIAGSQNSKALKEANDFFDSFNKVFNVGGNSTTSEVIEDMGGYTSRSGKHYTDEELMKRFQPKYSYESE